MLFEQLPVAQVIWATAITAIAGLAYAIVRAIERYKMVKLALKGVKRKKKAKAIRATARLLDERRWRRSAWRWPWSRSSLRG